MSTFVAVNTYTYSITYLAEKLLLSLKDVIRETGLDPAKLTDDWEVLQDGISTWLGTRDLETVHLEIYDLKDDSLVLRWDLEIVYDAYSDGGMWVDTDDLRYHILKAGRAPLKCKYSVKVHTKNGRPDVDGWYRCSFRSTDGMSRHSIGTMINASNGLGSRAAYWR